MLVAALVALLSSGCLAGDLFQAKAAQPILLSGYNYDGAGVRQVEGTLDVNVNPAKNAGRILADYHDAVHTYRIQWANFTGRAPYQSGGVATNQLLWGTSGNGSAALPAVRAYVAAFGSVTAHRDGVLERDPSNLFGTMNAVFFISQGRFRDLSTHKIYAADGVSLYDPEEPEDAYVNKIGAQATLLVYTARGELFRYVEFSEVSVLSA